ncbi:MAG: hypothetical protein SFW35_05290 [Chitinophagales bacterium]|nr:hypothetical protein [Chitinophagales bacterium]
MEYAATYHIGYHSKTQAAKTKKAAPTGQRIHRLDAADKGRKRNSQQQAEVRPAADVANGFLKATFLPKLETMQTVADATAIEKTENDFYRSLSRLAKHYEGFEPTDTRAFGYPYNMALSVWETENHLKRKVKDWSSLRLVQDDKDKTFFITEHRYDTGMNLYYIPVIPIYRMLRNRRTKKTASLLLSVCSYLYHIADIPYYRQEGTHLYWEYEMIKDWIEQDDECKEDNRLAELAIAEWAGDRMEQKLFNRKNLEVLAQRIKAFRPENQYEQECLQLAQQALSLYTDYPATNVFAHGTYGRYDEEQEEVVIRMDKYISFVATTKGWLYETLADCINNEFNEYGEMEEPLIEKKFDGTPLTIDSLAFEDKLFTLMDELCYLLNNDLNERS